MGSGSASNNRLPAIPSGGLSLMAQRGPSENRNGLLRRMEFGKSSMLKISATSADAPAGRRCRDFFAIGISRFFDRTLNLRQLDRPDSKP